MSILREKAWLIQVLITIKEVYKMKYFSNSLPKLTAAVRKSTVRNTCLQLLTVVIIYLISSLQYAHAERGIFPKYRVVGYYGNFLSTKMGVLGEYPRDEMLSMLKNEMRKWAKADPETPVIPAIEYIAVVAQKDAGRDGKYRARMSDSEIQKALDIAEQVNGIVILDIQVGLSDLESEIPRLEKYLRLPNVMLGIDPEFSMPNGARPGTRIGTVDAKDINYAINYLAHIVQKYDLPPKILVVHRFTQKMVTNHNRIELLPEVQVVMDMDGWGPQSLKRDSYQAYIAREPVQYTGIKLFYKHDSRDKKSGLFTPDQIMKLEPVPMFILYQ